MRLFRMLAVLLSNLLDRVRRALLSWAGVAVSAETHDAEAVDDRPAVWLEYVRARAPGLVAGKRHLPSRAVPTIEPGWPAPPAPSGIAPLDAASHVPPPPAPGRATPVARLTVPRATTRPTLAPAKQPQAAPDVRRSVPTPPAQATQPRGAAPANQSSRPTATLRPTAARTPGGARTSGQAVMVTQTHASAPIPVRQSPDAAPSAVAGPPRHPLRETVSRTGVAPRAKPSEAKAQWPERVAERSTFAHGAPRSVVQTDVLEDDSLWVHLPETGSREWEVQSTRSLIREQLHLVRLLKEQAGSSWSALHS